MHAAHEHAPKAEQPQWADDPPLLLPLLPPELPWTYLVVPLPAAYMLSLRAAERASPAVLALLVKSYLPFVAYGLVFHFAYRDLMPRWLGATSSRWWRLAIHVAFALVAIPLTSLVLLPIIHSIDGREDAVEFVLVSYIFAAMCLIPAVTLQRLRLRAQRAEHHALIESKVRAEAQLAALQARTDPHFLFNSLNTVASLIPDDPELAERTLERLSDLFRYALESSHQRTVSLERELTLVADYLELQVARFGARLQTRISITHELAGVEVPPLLLQPLVENAILHGASRERGGKVEVAVRREQDRLIIEVSDDGPGPGGSSRVGAQAEPVPLRAAAEANPLWVREECCSPQRARAARHPHLRRLAPRPRAPLHSVSSRSHSRPAVACGHAGTPSGSARTTLFLTPQAAPHNARSLAR